MPPILSLDADDIRCFQSEGKPFTRLVDGAIRASAARGGIPDAALATTLRTSVNDGGVDTRVDTSSSSDTSGRFRCPTIWQYKSGKIASPGSKGELEKLREELHKPYSKQKILAGYGYRLVIAESLTAQQKESWEKTLTEATHAIYKLAPPALVVTADDLAAWCSEFPALVVELKSLDLGEFQTFSTWRDNVANGATPRYVPVEVWKPQHDAIVAHCDLSRAPRRGVFTLSGLAGVGKTRLTFEVLRSLQNTASVVVYTRESSEALKLVRHALNEARCTAIVVADECPLDTRQKLDELLEEDSSHRQRIRVIAIEVTRPGQADQFLEEMPTEVVAQILEKNHVHVPGDRRASYAKLARGYVRFATHLCDEDPLAQGMVVSEGWISDYLDNRIPRSSIAW